jgi:hypothetical protein
MVTNPATSATPPQFFGVVPTKDGWVALVHSNNGARTASSSPPSLNPAFMLTKVYSDERISMPYPDGWEITADPKGQYQTLGPPVSVNNITLSNGEEWVLEGAYIMPLGKIVMLAPFMDQMVPALFKNDTQAVIGSQRQTTVAGRPAITVEYTTSSKVDGHQEWGLILTTNSTAGGVFIKMYCPLSKQQECSNRYNEMLRGARLK